MDELKQELEALQARAYELENNENEDEYNDMLNDVYGDIDIAGMMYNVATILKEVDPTAYRCGHSDFNDSLLSDVNNEIADKEQEISELAQLNEIV